MAIIVFLSLFQKQLSQPYIATGKIIIVIVLIFVVIELFFHDTISVFLIRINLLFILQHADLVYLSLSPRKQNYHFKPFTINNNISQDFSQCIFSLWELSHSLLTIFSHLKFLSRINTGEWLIFPFIYYLRHQTSIRHAWEQEVTLSHSFSHSLFFSKFGFCNNFLFIVKVPQKNHQRQRK